MLRRVRDTLRPILSASNEYRVRRALYRTLPVMHSSAHARLLHASVWKAGSQYVRLVLSDPRVFRAGGALPFVWRHVVDQPEVHRALLASDKCVLTAAYDNEEAVWRNSWAGRLTERYSSYATLAPSWFPGTSRRGTATPRETPSSNLGTRWKE